MGDIGRSVVMAWMLLAIAGQPELVSAAQSIQKDAATSVLDVLNRKRANAPDFMSSEHKFRDLTGYWGKEVGVDALAKWRSAIEKSFANLVFTPKRIFTGRKNVVIEGLVTGKHVGTFLGYKATSRDVISSFVYYGTFVRGELVRSSILFSNDEIRFQLEQSKRQYEASSVSGSGALVVETGIPVPLLSKVVLQEMHRGALLAYGTKLSMLQGQAGKGVPLPRFNLKKISKEQEADLVGRLRKLGSPRLKSGFMFSAGNFLICQMYLEASKSEAIGKKIPAANSPLAWPLVMIAMVENGNVTELSAYLDTHALIGRSPEGK